MAMPSKAKIFEYWMDWLDEKGFDWGEPSCWACRRYYSNKYDISNPLASREEIIRNWNRVPLQRCHIIPKQFGGTDGVNNLFLMCIECHDKAPNTKSKEAFMKWVSKQNYNRDFYELVMKELKIFELQGKTKIINNLIKNNNLWDEIEDNLGFHFNQSRGGKEITISTIIAALAEYLKEQEKE